MCYTYEYRKMQSLGSASSVSYTHLEGLDFEKVMREDYPAEWITSPFDPGKIVDAQTANFYYFFYDEQDSMSCSS